MKRYHRKTQAALSMLLVPLFLVSTDVQSARAQDSAMSYDAAGDTTQLHGWLRVGANVPTNEFDTTPRLSGGLRADLPFGRMDESSGPYAGLSFSWWEIRGEGAIGSEQLPDGDETYRASGRALYPALEFGYRFPEVAGRFVPWAGGALGVNAYKVNVRTFDTVDSASGSALGLDAQLGVDMPLDFGGAVQLMLGFTHSQATTPDAQPLLGRSNLGGLTFGLGYSHELADW